MRKILFICDPLHTFRIQTDNTYSLLVAANDLNIEVYYCLPQHIFAINEKTFAKSSNLTILATTSDKPGDVMPWYKEHPHATLSLTEFTAVFVRNDPPFNMEYYYLTQILSIAEHQDVRVVNNSHALRNFNEKLSILNFPQFVTPTLVSKDKDIILEFLYAQNECVVKPLDLMAGRGVFKISLSDVNHMAILEVSTNYFSQTVMVQKFIPEVSQGDKRIFIVNGQVISHCLYRIPQGNQIRGNIAAGGRGEVHPINSEDHVIASEIAKWLIANNIQFAGIDLIGNKLTEINITSPTGTRQIFNATGIDIPKLIIEAVL
jgi:glutathione synthase